MAYPQFVMQQNPFDETGTEKDASVLFDEEVTEPPKFKVWLLNDDYTTFDFVVKVLVTVFKKSIEEAVQITSDVHHKGKGICGIYTKEIAETKVALVENMSQVAGYPLKCEMEQE